MVDEGRAGVECCGDSNGCGHCHDCSDRDNVGDVSGHCSERRRDGRRRRSRGRRRVNSQIDLSWGRCNGRWDVDTGRRGHGWGDRHGDGRRGRGWC